MNKQKISFVDLFSGSGVVARFAKQHSDFVVANDLEYYSYIINKAYLTNAKELDLENYFSFFDLLKQFENENHDSFVRRLYSPIDDENINPTDRTFYTNENASYIDNMLWHIESVPQNLKPYFIAPLLSEASIHVNTAGIFKGFYKNKNGIGAFGGEGANALSRIKGKISLEPIILSNFNCRHEEYNLDANILIQDLDLMDAVYIDPPYNQHPYGSNYFMLNQIAKNKSPDEANISRVSGIPNDWNRSAYNSKSEIFDSFNNLISNVKARYVLVSYNNEGFLSKKEIETILSKHGQVHTFTQDYSAFKGSRNLRSRPTKTQEYLFILKKA